MGQEEKKPLLADDGQDGVEITSSEKKKSLRDYIPKLSKESITILIYVVLYITCGVINSVLLKQVMNTFSNYGFFLNQLTNFGYIPIFGVAVAYKMFFTNDIPKETRQFPLYKFLIMGALDAVTGYFVVIGGISTSGPLQQLLNQAIIPITMLVSFFILKERYSWIQLVGAVVIVGGVVTSLIPSLTGGGNSGNKPFWNFFYLISIIPYAFSNVYKDIGFKAVEDMDVWYLQYWDCVFQSIIGTILFPINAALPPPATIPFNSIGPSLKNGSLCLAGHDNILATDSMCGPLTTDPMPCDNCHNAWIVILVYMTINVIYNIFILLVIKYAGATVFSIANTLRLPLTNIVFSLKFIMGKNVVPFSGLSIAGLIIILGGLTTYRVGSTIKAKKAGVEQEIRFIPGMGPAGVEGMVPIRKQYIEPKSQEHLRNQFFGKLGIAVPEHRYNRSQINDA